MDKIHKQPILLIMKKIFYKLISSIFFLIFGFTVLGTVLGIYNGTASSWIELFKILASLNIAKNYPLAIAYTLGQVAIQMLMLWLFYFLGRKCWKISMLDD